MVATLQARRSMLLRVSTRHHYALDFDFAAVVVASVAKL